MTTAFMEEKLSDEALLGDFNEVIAYAKNHSQLSVSGLVRQLTPLVENYKELNSVLYHDIKSYHDAGQKAIDEYLENSFDNQTGMLRRLTEIKSVYLESLVKTFSE